MQGVLEGLAEQEQEKDVVGSIKRGSDFQRPGATETVLQKVKPHPIYRCPSYSAAVRRLQGFLL